MSTEQSPTVTIQSTTRSLTLSAGSGFCLAILWSVFAELLSERSPKGMFVFGVTVWLWILTVVCLARSSTRELVVLSLTLVFPVILLDQWIPAPRHLANLRWGTLLATTLFVATRIQVRTFVQRNVPRWIVRSTWFATITVVVLLVLATAISLSIGLRDQTQHADAALILGLSLDPQGQPLPGLIGRVQHGSQLYHRGFVSKIIVTGGQTNRCARTEADAMAELAVSFGVPRERIILERRARSTVENFAFSSQLLRSHGIRTVVVVTEPYHIARAMILARRYNVHAFASPARNSPGWTDTRSGSYGQFRDGPLFLIELFRSVVY